MQGNTGYHVILKSILLIRIFCLLYFNFYSTVKVKQRVIYTKLKCINQVIVFLDNPVVQPKAMFNIFTSNDTQHISLLNFDFNQMPDT